MWVATTACWGDGVGDGLSFTAPSKLRNHGSPHFGGPHSAVALLYAVPLPLLLRAPYAFPFREKIAKNDRIQNSYKIFGIDSQYLIRILDFAVAARLCIDG